MDVWVLVLILLGVIAIESAVFIWWIIKIRREVRTLHWRLDSIWKKVQKWHTKVDKVTGEVRRMTGEQLAIEGFEDEEDFDDIDRDADTKPTKKKKTRRK